jgi:hypothetical protein
MTMTRPNGSLTAAFGTLNDLGYIAREDFACCGNCAGYELTMLADEEIDQGRSPESIRGAVSTTASTPRTSPPGRTSTSDTARSTP